jgi:hypothetical protein
MKTTEQHRSEFESFYTSTYIIRWGAYGIASKHLQKRHETTSEGVVEVYVSEHAALCWFIWLASALENDK